MWMKIALYASRLELSDKVNLSDRLHFTFIIKSAFDSFNALPVYERTCVKELTVHCWCTCRFTKFQYLMSYMSCVCVCGTHILWFFLTRFANHLTFFITKLSYGNASPTHKSDNANMHDQTWTITHFEQLVP